MNSGSDLAHLVNPVRTHPLAQARIPRPLDPIGRRGVDLVLGGVGLRAQAGFLTWGTSGGGLCFRAGAPSARVALLGPLVGADVGPAASPKRRRTWPSGPWLPAPRRASWLAIVRSSPVGPLLAGEDRPRHGRGTRDIPPGPRFSTTISLQNPWGERPTLQPAGGAGGSPPDRPPQAGPTLDSSASTRWRRRRRRLVAHACGLRAGGTFALLRHRPMARRRPSMTPLRCEHGSRKVVLEQSVAVAQATHPKDRSYLAFDGGSAAAVAVLLACPGSGIDSRLSNVLLGVNWPGLRGSRTPRRAPPIHESTMAFLARIPLGRSHSDPSLTFFGSG